MFIGTINRKKISQRLFRKRFVGSPNLYNRHEELVKEMTDRGYTHYSEVNERWKLVDKAGSINEKKSVAELANRCNNCKRRHVALES